MVDPQTVTRAARAHLHRRHALDAEAVRTGLLHTLASRDVEGVAPCRVQVPPGRHRGRPDQGDDAPERRGPVLRLPRDGETRVSPTRSRSARRSTTSRSARDRSSSPRTPQGQTLSRRTRTSSRRQDKLGGIELIKTTRPASTPGHAPTRCSTASPTRAAAGPRPGGGSTAAGSSSTSSRATTTAIYAALCPNKPPFDNPEVRKAVN